MTQAMGRWVSADDEKDWPLHLAQSHVAGPDTDLHSGLASTLADIDEPALNPVLREAQNNITAAIAAFPDGAKILPLACSALRYIRDAIQVCPDQARGDILHKLTRKETQLSHLITIAAGVQVHARLDKSYLNAGDGVEITTELRPGMVETIAVKSALPKGWSQDQNRLITTVDVQVTDPYPSFYLPDTPRLPCIEASLVVHGEQIVRRFAFETPPVVLPAYSAAITPDADVINSAVADRTLTIAVKDIFPPTAKVSLLLPDHWQATKTETGFIVTAPDDVSEGRYSLGLLLDGRPAQQVRKIKYSHIDPRAVISPAELSIQVVHVALPDVRVGYIGGGNDRVDHWLDRLGVDVAAVSDDNLKSDTALARFDTLVIGIFALKFRDGLAEQMPRLHRWCERGGTLLTLYHRPWDNWDPDRSPPRPLEIGQPSLRWRVTDETAKVDVLQPNSPLMTRPNQITDADWENWQKERGLYFAKQWDPAYLPILSMADPKEQPLQGALLCADIGKGRHIHTSLILHHQMEKTTPGAFRIMANLLAKRDVL
ncbi:hypothetical protein [Parasedimentitalea psychrophila]|uniref:hypothetical protein n=1 Tax=Parasedimentitalea psychrophila TaxID=2997337 RepID=UPI0022EAEC5F|nr:hypothetical protein [Parasedimentitalea psychrophila]